MKAWVVINPNKFNSGTLVFADTRTEAKDNAVAELNVDGSSVDVSIYRYHKYDDCEDTPPSLFHLIQEDGWEGDCDHCTKRVSKTPYANDNRYAKPGAPLGFNAVLCRSCARLNGTQRQRETEARKTAVGIDSILKLIEA